MFAHHDFPLRPAWLFGAAVWLCLTSAQAGNVRYEHGVKIIYGESAAGGTAGHANANGALPKIYRYRVGGVTTFSDLAPARGYYAVVNFSCYACNPSSRIDWQETRLFRDEYSEAIEPAAQQFGVDPALVRAVIHAESGFNAKAKSPKGAMGLMQLMPATAREVGVGDAFVPAQNIRGGVRYLASLLARFRNDTTLATAAYNAGPEAVEKYSGVPPYAETQAYVQRVNLLHQRYRAGSR